MCSFRATFMLLPPSDASVVRVNVFVTGSKISAVLSVFPLPSSPPVISTLPFDSFAPHDCIARYASSRPP